MMNQLADALTQAAWREVHGDASPRQNRRRVHELKRLLEIDGTKLGSDGSAFVQRQCEALEREIYGTGTMAELVDGSVVLGCDCVGYSRNFTLTFDDQDLRHWSRTSCPFCGKPFKRKH